MRLCCARPAVANLQTAVASCLGRPELQQASTDSAFSKSAWGGGPKVFQTAALAGVG